MTSNALQTNANFQQVLDELAQVGNDANRNPADEPLHQQFIARFPADRLPDLSLTEYCVGKGDGDSFCWWLERGLQPLLGRYMPGTSRGHILYFQKDGAVYKNRLLKGLSDEEALRYTLRIQACIAQADMGEDPRWIDSDAQLYERAGVEARVTVGDGRKLRLLACYHPNEALPIASSSHVGHFLKVLGHPDADIPPKQQPVARMLLLRKYLHLAQQQHPGLSPVDFMRALYKPELGLAPIEEEVELEDGEVNSDIEIFLRLTGGAVRNGYVRIPKTQSLFPSECIARDERAESQQFSLTVPGGSEVETCLLANRGRIKARFNSLFNTNGLMEGDYVRIQKASERRYVLSFERNEATDAPALRQAPSPKEAERLKNQPLNQILYGPPGTGKTFHTIDAALEILDPTCVTEHPGDQGRAARKARFDAFARERRIRFVTFHQSFSYEDFVEGIRAGTIDEAGEGALDYSVERGVFGALCTDAARNHEADVRIGVGPAPTVWKLSISENSSKDRTRQYCFDHGEARIGWEAVGDVRRANLADPALHLGRKDQASLQNFTHEMQVGDVVLCLGSKTSVRAVGVVAGEYEYSPTPPAGVREDYVHRRAVRWLNTQLDFDITALNGGKQLTLQTVYPLTRIEWPRLEDALSAAGALPQSVTAPTDTEKPPYVLIIDEINRGNISRIFGELITLIEPSKRAGAPEALEVVLPYSKKPFSVPSNVHLIGTMNTADRSLAAMDVALRRRFVFKEMPPRPGLLQGLTVGTIRIDELLSVMNQRIEALLDRDHCLGHAYFMPLRDDDSPAKLAEIFRVQVLPLLQEYFFDDWQRIQWVLNDHRKRNAAYRFVTTGEVDAAGLFGDSVNIVRSPQLWRINEDAFLCEQSYLGVIHHEDASA